METEIKLEQKSIVLGKDGRFTLNVNDELEIVIFRRSFDDGYDIDTYSKKKDKGVCDEDFIRTMTIWDDEIEPGEK